MEPEDILRHMQELNDRRYRELYGDEKYRAMVNERRLRHVCYKCRYSVVDDEGKIEMCDLVDDDGNFPEGREIECMRQHEKDFIKMEEDARG